MSTVNFLDELCDLLDKYDVEIEPVDTTDDVSIYIKSTGDILNFHFLDVDNLSKKVKEMKSLDKINVYKAGI